jgi:integrase
MNTSALVPVNNVPPTWGELAELWLTAYHGDTYLTYKAQFSMWLVSRGFTDETVFKSLPDEEEMEAYKAGLLQTCKKPATINLYMASVRSFYRWMSREVRRAVREDRIDFSQGAKMQVLIDAVLAVPPAKNHNGSPRAALSIEQARTLLDMPDLETTKGIRDRAILALMLGTGIRRVEVSRALLGDLKRLNGHAVLAVQQKGHTSADATVTIHESLYRELRPWLSLHSGDKGSPLFYCLDDRPGIRKLQPKVISNLVRFYLIAARLSEFDAHSLRHTFATIALQSVDIREVQHALGHSNQSTTERYLHDQSRLDGKPEEAVGQAIFQTVDH